MRHLILALVLCCANVALIENANADAASVAQAITDGKSLEQILQQAVDNGEDLVQVLKDVIAADATQAYQATIMALALKPSQKEALMSAAISVGLDRSTLNQMISNAVVTTKVNGQNKDVSLASLLSTSNGGSTTTGLTFVSVKSTPPASIGGGGTVDGGSCTGTKDPVTGISKCASPR